ncbi:MAG: hypothetical protein C0629_16735, partial [Chromatiales bacterium]
KITTHCTRDSTPVPDLLAPMTRGLASVRADGAYDGASVFRSLVENAMSRVKNEFGGALRSRTIQTQDTEVRIACTILNTMTRLGMADGHCVS